MTCPRSAGAVLGAALLVVTVAAGCSPPPPSYEPGPRIDAAPVAGEVWVNGKPAANARVAFFPVPYNAFNTEFRTLTDDAGRFQCTTNVENDGLPPGKYLVTVTWPERVYEDWQTEIDRLNGRYAVPQRSGLQVEVKNGNNQLPPFKLQ